MRDNTAREETDALRVHIVKSVNASDAGESGQNANAQLLDLGDGGANQTHAAASTAPDASARAREIGGPKGPEPTRYGDWERKGRCVDF